MVEVEVKVCTSESRVHLCVFTVVHLYLCGFLRLLLNVSRHVSLCDFVCSFCILLQSCCLLLAGEKPSAVLLMLLSRSFFFLSSQFTVGVLNATLRLAALVLVGVAAFLGSEVVLALFMWGWVLVGDVGVTAFLGLDVVCHLGP